MGEIAYRDRARALGQIEKSQKVVAAALLLAAVSFIGYDMVTSVPFGTPSYVSVFGLVALIGAGYFQVRGRVNHIFRLSNDVDWYNALREERKNN